MGPGSPVVEWITKGGGVDAGSVGRAEVIGWP